MMLFAAAVSTVFATLARDEVREQIRLGARMFSSLVIGAYALAWILFALYR